MGFFSAVKKFFGGGDEKVQDIKEKHEEIVETSGILSDDREIHPETKNDEKEPVDLDTISECKSVDDEITANVNPVITQAEEQLDYENEESIGLANKEYETAAELKKSGGNDPADISSANEMLVRLRDAEPKLSKWLEIVLEDVDAPGQLLWDRIAFLLRSLDAPQEEIEKFIDEFQKWLERMEYAHIDEFRSELQYQLALALDLEDEEDERSRLFIKLSEGLAKTREQFSRRLDKLFASKGELDESFWEELEELFIMADLGYEPAMELTSRLRERARKEKITSRTEIRHLLHAEVEDIFRVQKKITAVNPPEVVLMIGVNGAGKTTTIAKLAHRAKMQGKKVLVAAGDTFRAAAIDQLAVWAERAGVEFFAKAPGTDPAAVAYEAVDHAIKNGLDIIFVDTAGRLQTKTNLMQELGKIRQVLGKKHPGAPHRSILVLDATTGQNALSQAKLFKEAANADELILTKLDGTAKGGVAIAVAMQENLPISYIGLGEKMEDLRPFNGEDYASALLGTDKTEAALCNFANR